MGQLITHFSLSNDTIIFANLQSYAFLEKGRVSEFLQAEPQNPSPTSQLLSWSMNLKRKMKLTVSILRFYVRTLFSPISIIAYSPVLIDFYKSEIFQNNFGAITIKNLFKSRCTVSVSHI